MIIRFFLFLVFPTILTGCVASKSPHLQNNTESQAVLSAQFKSAKGREAIETYLDKFSFDSTQAGAFSKDPFSDRYKWATRSNNTEAKKEVLDDSSMVLLLNDEFLVWEEELKKYLQSSIGKGRQLFEQKNYLESLKYFIEFSKINPKDWYVLNRLGWTYLHLGDYEDSVNNFQRSSTLTTRNKWNYYGIAKANYWLGHYDAAANYAEQSYEIFQEKKSNDEKIKYLIAMIHLAKGNYKSAFKSIGKMPLIGINTDKTKNGFLIKKVYKGSPADLLGLEPGDIITELNNLTTVSTNKLKLLYKFDYGKQIPIKISRNGMSYNGEIFIGITPLLRNDFVSNLSLMRQKADNNNTKQDGISESVQRAEMYDAKQNLPYKNNTSTKVSNQWAIVIGISNYQYSGQNGLTNLIFADDDAKIFTRSLRSLGWSESHIKLLINEEATQRNIMIALESWLSKAGPNDQIILFWAGHGYPDPEDPEKVYFACYDTDISIPATGYRMARVRRSLEERKSKNVILLADTCHAGKLITRDIGDRGISIVRNIRKQNIPKGWVFMVGADTDRQAIEHTSWSNGAFTHSLIKGINGEADGFQSAGAKDGVVTMGELKDYMKTSMPDETQRVLGVAKHPVITTSTGDPDIWNLTLQVTQ